LNSNIKSNLRARPVTGWMVGGTLTGTYTSKFPSRNLPNLH